MVPLSKSGVRKHRGFESHPLRHQDRPAPGRPWRRWRLRSSLTDIRVRSLRSSPAAFAWAPMEPAGRYASLPRRGRLVDYGAALEMRFAATRRGFESRPLRHFGRHPDADHLRPGSGYTAQRRARRGTSGALYLQSAPAGLNSLPRSSFSQAAASSDVEDRVPRSGEPRTVSGPEGSSTKRSSSGAAERPGPSRSLRRARGRPDRRRVHGYSSSRAADPGAS